MEEEQMRRFADALLAYFMPRIEDYLSDSVCYFKASVTTAPGGGVIGVTRPFDIEVFYPFAWSAADLRVGDACTVLMFGDASNCVVIGDGGLSKPAAVPEPYGSDPEMDGPADPGASDAYARGDHRHPTDTTRSPIESPAFTGTPTAPTAAEGTDSGQIATTAFVQAAAKRFSFAFAVSDWAGSGPYSLSLPAASHGCGTDPDVSVYVKNGAVYETFYGYPSAGWKLQIAANGDLALTAAAAFDGKLKVSK